MDSETRQRLVAKAETGDWRTMTDLALAIIQLDAQLERLEQKVNTLGTQRALGSSRYVR